MRVAYAATGLALLLIAQSSAAQTGVFTLPLPVQSGAAKATICLDRAGRASEGVATCRGERITGHFTCQRPAATVAVIVPACEAGEHPAPETAAARLVRSDALAHGDVQRARFEGRRFCAPVEHPEWDLPMFTSDPDGNHP
jgi:hypothetical protein